jgi:hypothetical protein
MGRIKTVQVLKMEHKGKEIVYREDENVWACDELSLTAPTLKTLRGQIDRFDSSERKVNVPAYLIERSYWSSDKALAKKVTVTILCDGNDKGHCWVKTASGERQKERIESLVPLSEKADIDAWIAADRAATQAQKAAERLKEAIPRFNEDSIMLANKEQEQR